MLLQNTEGTGSRPNLGLMLGVSGVLFVLHNISLHHSLCR